jgi:hypothetical protein
MADEKKQAEEQEELRLEKEKLADLDVSEDEAGDVRGGQSGTCTQLQGTCNCETR